ncbi:MAG: sulfurtransferase TusA family protein [Sedimenticola sp.]
MQSSSEKGKPKNEELVDLQGKLCPFAVMCVIRGVDGMLEGEEKTYLVDDPLAIKSVPEELSEYSDVSCKITKIDSGWAISVKKDAS